VVEVGREPALAIGGDRESGAIATAWTIARRAPPRRLSSWSSVVSQSRTSFSEARRARRPSGLNAADEIDETTASSSVAASFPASRSQTRRNRSSPLESPRAPPAKARARADTGSVRLSRGGPSLGSSTRALREARATKARPPPCERAIA
jgi:hypothetical protein